MQLQYKVLGLWQACTAIWVAEHLKNHIVEITLKKDVYTLYYVL